MVGETGAGILIPADLSVAGAAAEKARLLAAICDPATRGAVAVELDRAGLASVVALQLLLALGQTLGRQGRQIVLGANARAALDRHGASMDEAA